MDSKRISGGEVETWLDVYQEPLSVANEKATEVATQNELHQEITTSVTTEALSSVALSYLSDQQTETFRTLKEHAAEVPYEELAEADLAVEKQLANTTVELDRIDTMVREKLGVVYREAELIADRLPDLSKTVGEIAARMQGELEHNEREAVIAERQRLLEAREAVNKAFGAIGQAWELPQIIDYTTGQPHGIYDIDEFPAEKQELTTEEVVERVKRKYPESILMDASAYLALILAEEPKRPYMIGEIAEALYGEDSEVTRPRVSSLVSNYELDKVSIIGTTLEKEGLVFQRGARRRYDTTLRATIGRSTPVFRAISPAELFESEAIIHPEPAVEDTWPVTVSVERIPTQPTPVVEVSVAPAVEAPVPPAEVPTEPIEAIELNESWQEKVARAIDRVIAEFDELGLMQEREHSIKVVRQRHPSTIMATETMLDRALRNKLISRAATKNEDTLLGVEQFIAMSLQNSFAQEFSARSRRLAIEQMISRAVSRFYIAQNRTA